MDEGQSQVCVHATRPSAHMLIHHHGTMAISNQYLQLMGLIGLGLTNLDQRLLHASHCHTIVLLLCYHLSLMCSSSSSKMNDKHRYLMIESAIHCSLHSHHHHHGHIEAMHTHTSTVAAHIDMHGTSPAAADDDDNIHSHPSSTHLQSLSSSSSSCTSSSIHSTSSSFIGCHSSCLASTLLQSMPTFHDALLVASLPACSQLHLSSSAAHAAQHTSASHAAVPSMVVAMMDCNPCHSHHEMRHTASQACDDCSTAGNQSDAIINHQVSHIEMDQICQSIQIQWNLIQIIVMEL